MIPCPLCIPVAEFAAKDLISHILADHRHEAAALTALLPILVAAYKKQWPLVILGLIFVALVLEDFQAKQRNEAAVEAAPEFAFSPVVYVPSVNLNVPPIYGPHYPHRFYATRSTTLR
jgi:hypothetical protein